jgi:protein-disulfide isomerase
MPRTRPPRFSLIDIATIVVLLLTILLVSLPGGALYNPVHAKIVQYRMTSAVRKEWPALSKMAMPLYSGSGPPAVIEFMDYQCPFCRAAEVVVDSAVRDGVRLAVIQLPLSIHRRAHAAALAAVCGVTSGDFAAVHHFLMDHGEWMSTANTSIVPSIGQVDSARVIACENSRQTQAVIERHLAEAKALGIAATPMFVYRGGVLDGPPTVMNLRRLAAAGGR